MKLLRFGGMWVLLALVGGCAANTSPESKPLRPANIDQVRARYQRLDPNARVGWVAFVTPQDQTVLIVDVPVWEARTRDLVTFVSADDRVVANGKVASVGNSSLTVQYFADERGQRPPQVGDLAVLFVLPPATEPARGGSPLR